MAAPPREADLSHPLSSLEWEKCGDMPFGVRDARVVWLDGKLYIGGGYAGSPDNDSIILCCDSDIKWWRKIKSPARRSALATYQGKLVLVGGMEVTTGSLTNKVWTLQDDDTWAEELPPMPTARWKATAVSTAGNNLLVAGGQTKGGAYSAAVEVFDGEGWARTESLPKGHWGMKSVLLDGEWCLMGGWWQGGSVFTATVDTLSATASAEEETSTVWRTLPEAPHKWSATAALGGHLLAIGGSTFTSYTACNAVYALIPDTQSWLYVLDLPEALWSTCCMALPSGELVMVGGENNDGISSSVYKASCTEAVAGDGKDVPVIERQLWEPGEAKQHPKELPLQEEVEKEKEIQKLKMELKSMTMDVAAERDELRAEIIVATAYLRGVDVIAERSFEVTNQAHTYQWEGYGMKLHVPQDSLPAEWPQCRVIVKASLSGQYTLPADCELVSGVYWIHCPAKFSKPLTLELQHHSLHREKLSFIRANCSQEQLPYSFEMVGGGVFSEHSSQGSISLSRFSGLGIAWLKSLVTLQPDSQSTKSSQSDSQSTKSLPSEDRNYSAQVCYTRDALNTWSVLFAIRRRMDLDLEDKIFHERLESTMRMKISQANCPFPVEFAADCIKLKVPEVTSGWKLTSPSPPIIFQRVVDDFRGRPGDLLPCCQLRVSSTGAQVGSKLEEKVSLEGAKEPYNHFLVECGPTTSGPDSICSPEQAALDSAPVLIDLKNQVAAKIPTKWRDLGLQLGLEPSTLDVIEADHRGNHNRCYEEVFKKWCSSGDQVAAYTWSSLIEALRAPSLDEPHLAHSLEQWLSSTPPHAPRED